MRQLFVASVALLVVQEALSYGTVRRRQKQPYPPPPQDRISTQYYPASHVSIQFGSLDCSITSPRHIAQINSAS